jgi:DNA end-binding protein Ku
LHAIHLNGIAGRMRGSCLEEGGIVPFRPANRHGREHEERRMARAMWKGAIQFGLVTIPVKLYLATESRAGVSFHMLHATDLSRIQMKIFCPEDDKLISRAETVKGFEYAPDQYVVITDEDLEKLPLKTVRSIEIEQFVERDEADDQIRFVKQSYYLEPDKVGRKAFALLKSVLADNRLSAICKVVIKDREALASLDPFDDTMVLSTLYWPDEIRSVKELDIQAEATDFKPAEKAMAEQLVAAMTKPFDPSDYHDEYREALQELIEAKVEGRETVEAPAPEQANIVDLMAALQASVAAASKAREAGAPISVSEAKARKATEKTDREASAKPAKEAGRGPARERAASGRRRAKAAAPAGGARSADEGSAEERPARRRKSA